MAVKRVVKGVGVSQVLVYQGAGGKVAALVSVIRVGGNKAPIVPLLYHDVRHLGVHVSFFIAYLGKLEHAGVGSGTKTGCLGADATATNMQM